MRIASSKAASARSRAWAAPVVSLLGAALFDEPACFEEVAAEVALLWNELETLFDVGERGAEVAPSTAEIREARARVGEHLAHLRGILLRRQGSRKQGAERCLRVGEVALLFVAVGEVVCGPSAPEKAHEHRIDRRAALRVVARLPRASAEPDPENERDNPKPHRAPHNA
jgi:hypothetical protein